VPDGVVDAQAHGLADVPLGETEAEGAEHLDLGGSPEWFRVDEQPIEIEDDSVDGPAAEDVR
jgi:hypothetical protein